MSSELGKLAALALEEDDSEKALEAIEGFCTAFAAWLTEQQALKESGEALSLSEADAKALIVLHEQVLQKAETLQDDTRKDMRSLRSKAKGILAYTGKLPDSISIAKKTKG